MPYLRRQTGDSIAGANKLTDVNTARLAYARLGFFAVRLLERIMPIAALRVALWPVIAIMALPRTLQYRKYDWKSPKLPEAFLCEGNNVVVTWRKWIGFFYARIPTMFPDRLDGEKWQQRFRCEGLEHLVDAIENRRPVVLATLHISFLSLIRYLLRCRGIHSALMVGSSRAHQVGMLKDRYLASKPGDRAMPPLLKFNDLRATRDFLEGGNILLMAVDVGMGKQLLTSTEAGNFRMASGAIRLARSTGAELMSCLLYEEKPWRFVVKIGQPIELAESRSDSNDQRAADSLVRSFLPTVVHHAAQYECGPTSFWTA
ncbi:MAG: Bacterial lipid biosynthesis acyltransferase [Verrucomicrobiota bacterium]|jgi:lauroyl/myristoyl acyltransferase